MVDCTAGYVSAVSLAVKNVPFPSSTYITGRRRLLPGGVATRSRRRLRAGVQCCRRLSLDERHDAATASISSFHCGLRS